jgi:hypothetical protein
MVAINMSGEGLPLYMNAKGKTELCERQLNAQDETLLGHSESGWVTVNLMQLYFEFLRFTVDQKYGSKKGIGCYSSSICTQLIETKNSLGTQPSNWALIWALFLAV